MSSATIRNEMAELEEMGYLYHPHTSAGRLPTEQGYRYFVETMLEERDLSPTLQVAIRSHFNVADSAPEFWVEMAAGELASATGNTALVTTPRAAEVRLRQLQIVCVNDSLALLVVVFADGSMRQQFLPLSQPVTQVEAGRIAEQLNMRYAGLSSKQVELPTSTMLDLHSQVQDALFRIMEQVDNQRYYDWRYDGLRLMLSQPEFEKPERVWGVLDLIDERSKLSALMAGTRHDDEPQVIIGSESNPMFPLPQCSIVVGSYGDEREAGGALAVLGPVRMEYELAVSSIRYVASVLNELLAELYGWRR